MEDVPARWNPAAGQRGVHRVEVWSKGQQVAEVAAGDEAGVISCSVTEHWVTGIRMNMSLTVEPSASWLRYAKLPGLEIRPFSGFSWGTSEFLCPLGRFPILPPAISVPAQAISFNGDDYWSWLVRAKDVARAAPAGRIKDVAADRFVTVGLRRPVVSADSDAVMPRVVWDAGAESARVIALMDSIGGMAFFDRSGVGRITDRTPGTGWNLTDGVMGGDLGTIISATTTRDWSQVQNRVTASSSNNAVKFDPISASVDDPESPAYFANGLGWVDGEYSSPYLTTRSQALSAARAEVQKRARSALSWQVTAVPDPARMAGDRINVVTEKLGRVYAVIQEITHSLTGDPMTMTLGAA